MSVVDTIRVEHPKYCTKLYLGNKIIFSENNLFAQHFFGPKNFLDPKCTWEWSLTLALAQIVFILDGVWGLLLIQTFLKNLVTPAPNGISKILNWNWDIFEKENQESYLAEQFGRTPDSNKPYLI